MKTVKKIVYQCEYCGKYRFTREGMEKHERECPLREKVDYKDLAQWL